MARQRVKVSFTYHASQKDVKTYLQDLVLFEGLTPAQRLGPHASCVLQLTLSTIEGAVIQPRIAALYLIREYPRSSAAEYIVRSVRAYALIADRDVRVPRRCCVP